jgi:hypothetical protein
LRFLVRETLINIAQLPKFHELLSDFEKPDLTVGVYEPCLFAGSALNKDSIEN